MSQINNLTLAQVAQKGNELNFYSQFRTRRPVKECQSKVIGLGSSYNGMGFMTSLKSGVSARPTLNCIVNSQQTVLTNNISTLPQANGEQFLGYGYPQGVAPGGNGNIYN